MTRKLSMPSRASRASCSILALATVLLVGASPAAAQSFDGTGVVVTNTGGAANIGTGPGTTFIEVNPGQTVIDWTPTPDGGAPGTAINFQPAGTTATFNSSGDYAVLNRLNVTDSSRIIALNGTIQSFIGGEFTGGSIYFYSPSGFVLGNGAVINVGSLVLSAAPIFVDPDTGNFIDSNNRVAFGGVADPFGNNVNPNAQIYTNPDSQIDATVQEDSYVALVAPRVEHHGTITVNGSAALVAAEAATITFRADGFSDGLFDIQVDVGTTDANGVVVDGTVTGPISSGAGDYHRAYLVAVPKNDALTMLISAGADLGFDIAGAADVVGNAVVLSAGHDISFGGSVDGPSVGSGADAHISIGNANFTSALYGRADGNAVASSVAGSLTFASDVSLRGRDLAMLEAGQGGSVTIGGGNVIGNLTMSANASGSTEGESAAAGDVTLQAFGGGAISVTGNTDLSAIGTGGSSSTEGLASGDGTGGTILVQATSGGEMTFGGSLNADATGRGGGIGGDGPVDGGDGFGGTVNVFTSGGSSMSVAGATSLRADGRAASTFECFTCLGASGVGDAGTINVQAHTGPENTMSFGNTLSIWANGYGGDARIGDGGAGLGGNISFSAADSSIVTVASDVSLQAEGYGGTALAGTGNGGLGQGGNIQAFAAEDGTLSLSASLQEYVGGYGGSAENGSGGLGQGGLGQLFTVGSSATVGGYASIFAAGHGGDGLVGGGEGHGGVTYFSTADGGSLSITGFASLSADGRGGRGYGADGAGGNGGDGYGGHVEAFANNGASLTFGSDLYLDAGGEGGGAGDTGTSAGDGIGGDIFLQAVGGGSVGLAQGLYANAEGLGGSGNFGVYSGNGTGGTITVIARDGTSSLTVTSEANLEADGYAGYASECSSQCSAGGIGQGGDIFIASTGVLTGSSLDFQSTLFASANGYGGESAIIDFNTNTTVDGGEGRGGTVNLYANEGNSLNVAAEVTLEAIGYGGYDPVNLAGGDGSGGIVRITTDSVGGNLITLGSSVVLDASGYGGDSGQSANGDGGDGFGGTARVAIVGGLLDIAGDLALYSNGQGGNTSGGTGGDGIGNIAQIDAIGGDIEIGGNAYADASGFGGDGAIGGNGLGGGNIIALTGGARILAFSGDIIVGGSAIILSEGTGGDGSFGGGTGGDGTGGLASIFAGNNDLGPSSITIQGVESSAFASASGFGGNGGDGISGIDGESGGTGTEGGAGGAGGNGGTGTGGRAAVSAAAGNGTLNIGLVFAEATGTGGAGGIGGNGGLGGNGDGGPAGNGGVGGAGGAGGEAVGGLVTVGVASGDAQAAGVNAGTANFGSVLLNASAQGGAGGAGGTGGAGGLGTPDGIAGADGNGGDGGFANGGTANLIVFGGTVSLFSADLVANATGGDGGNGTIAGAGGDAESDEVGVIVTQRGSDTSLRGTLDAEIITGTVNSTGGSGSTLGLGLMEGGSNFTVENGDVTLGSLDVTITADGQIADLATDSIAIVNGTVTVDGAFNFTTAGVASIYAEVGDPDTGTLNAASFNVAADNFIHDPERSFPAAVGTISADSFDLSTNGDLIIDAHLISTSALNLSAPGLIDIEDATSGDNLTLNAGSSISGGSMTAANAVTADAAGDINLNLVIAGSDIDIQSTGGTIATNAQSAGGSILLDGEAGVSTGDLTAGGLVQADSAGAISTGHIGTFGAVDLTAGTSIGTGNVDADSVTMSAGTNITTGDITAFGAVDLDALGFILTGDILAASIDLFAGGDITTGDLTTEIVDLFQNEEEVVALLFPGASITLESGGDISTENISSYDGVYASAGGGITAGTIDAADFVQLLAGANIATGDIDAGAYIDIFSSGGGIATANLTGTQIDLEANGDISFANVDADALDFDATGAVTGGDIIAFSQVGGEAQGAVALGDIIVGPGAAQADDFSVGIASATSISVGNVSGTDRIGFATFGDLTTGNLSASDLVMALVGGDIVTGSITTDADGTVYMGDASMYIDAGGGEDAFDPSLVLALDPVPTGGSITIGGPVSTGLFQAAAGEGLTTGAIDAQTIEASAGGTATLNGLWSAETVTLASNDIDITDTGGISGGGLVTLISTNATQALIGDGLTGTGYALSNAEFGRIEGGSVHILARGDASAAIDMLIGDLTVTGPAAGSTIEDSDGILVFATGDIATQTPGGVIRVVGDVGATGFGAGNAMEFHADRFELDAATGSISIATSGTTLGGELGLYASQIHVASGEILDQLAVDPQYDGYQDDLNAPAAMQRPEGVLNAGVIWIESDELQSILIQNTGSAETPAGFLANEIFVNEDFEVAGPPGSIDVVVNGQLITETGTLTGVAVRDALVAGEDLTPFTANSTINGCLLAGPCGVVEPPEPPFPPGFTPTPGIQNEVVLIKHNLLPPPEFGNEDFIDDNNDITDEGATSPIKPPHPLFDTSALGDKGDVNDPVSGSGNPALMETPAGSPPAQEKQP